LIEHQGEVLRLRDHYLGYHVHKPEELFSGRLIIFYIKLAGMHGVIANDSHHVQRDLNPRV